MNLSDAIRNRRSIRKYKSRSLISDEDIKKILEAAMMAPSACNTRPWEFIVLKSEESRQKAINIHPYAKHLATASTGIIVCAIPNAQIGISNGFFPQDCGAAIENMLLQSLDLGYGSCWCGIYPIEERVKLYKETFNINSVPLALVIIGAADEEPMARGFYEESKVTVL